jgi:hypothetical protein
MRMLILGGRGDESGIEFFRRALAQSVVYELQSACSHPAKEFYVNVAQSPRHHPVDRRHSIRRRLPAGTRIRSLRNCSDR